MLLLNEYSNLYSVYKKVFSLIESNFQNYFSLGIKFSNELTSFIEKEATNKDFITYFQEYLADETKFKDIDTYKREFLEIHFKIKEFLYKDYINFYKELMFLTENMAEILQEHHELLKYKFSETERFIKLLGKINAVNKEWNIFNNKLSVFLDIYLMQHGPLYEDNTLNISLKIPENRKLQMDTVNTFMQYITTTYEAVIHLTGNTEEFPHLEICFTEILNKNEFACKIRMVNTFLPTYKDFLQHMKNEPTSSEKFQQFLAKYSSQHMGELSFKKLISKYQKKIKAIWKHIAMQCQMSILDNYFEYNTFNLVRLCDRKIEVPQELQQKQGLEKKLQDTHEKNIDTQTEENDNDNDTKNNDDKGNINKKMAYFTG